MVLRSCQEEPYRQQDSNYCCFLSSHPIPRLMAFFWRHGAAVLSEIRYGVYGSGYARKPEDSGIGWGFSSVSTKDDRMGSRQEVPGAKMSFCIAMNHAWHAFPHTPTSRLRSRPIKPDLSQLPLPTPLPPVSSNHGLLPPPLCLRVSS
ncbi:hypothetical protein CRG98_043206 [Punica granatum]|uniref:Uncharacterized protein n=1 Tax=Punica granatum TaxID=22663 RepID=A0A2I0HXI8_PUNGR|nr:hypothetical protein CRG98_043206 [Punica granatum]